MSLMDNMTDEELRLEALKEAHDVLLRYVVLNPAKQPVIPTAEAVLKRARAYTEFLLEGREAKPGLKLVPRAD